MSSMKLTTIVGLLAAVFGAAIGGLGATVTFDSRVDTKIDRAIAPIASDVREIRMLVQQLILQTGSRK